MGRRTAGKGGGRETGRNGQSALCPRVVYSTRRPVAVLIGRSAGEAACGGSVQVVGALADGRDSPGRVTLNGARAASSSLSTLEGAADRELLPDQPPTRPVKRGVSMRIEPTQWHISFARLFVATSLLAACPSVLAQNDVSVLPVNAHSSRYGSGWECSAGFRRVHEACVGVTVPANAYLNSFGGDWHTEC